MVMRNLTYRSLMPMLSSSKKSSRNMRGKLLINKKALMAEDKVKKKGKEGSRVGKLVEIRLTISSKFCKGIYHKKK